MNSVMRVHNNERDPIMFFAEWQRGHSLNWAANPVKAETLFCPSFQIPFFTGFYNVSS